MCMKMTPFWDIEIYRDVVVDRRFRDANSLDYQRDVPVC
jgi:hypothetical protein